MGSVLSIIVFKEALWANIEFTDTKRTVQLKHIEQISSFVLRMCLCSKESSRTCFLVPAGPTQTMECWWTLSEKTARYATYRQQNGSSRRSFRFVVYCFYTFLFFNQWQRFALIIINRSQWMSETKPCYRRCCKKATTNCEFFQSREQVLVWQVSLAASMKRLFFQKLFPFVNDL